MDLKSCRSFLTIIESGSMNKAARQLGLTQPTLSRQIQKLETDLGAPLFERQAKSLHLTREGLMFARRAGEMLELERKTISELHSSNTELSGTLSIGCGEFATTAQLIQAAAEFQQNYPGVCIEFITGDGARIRELIDQGIVDLGLFLEPTNLDGLKSMCWKRRETWCALVPVDHPLAQKTSITPADLQEYPLILPYRPEMRSLIAGWFGYPVGDLPYAGTASLTAACAMMVLNRIGVGISLAGVDAYRRPDLQMIPLEPQLSCCLALAWKEQYPHPVILDRFLSYLTSQHLTCSCTSETECADDCCSTEQEES